MYFLIEKFESAMSLLDVSLWLSGSTLVADLLLCSANLLLCTGDTEVTGGRTG